MCNGASQLKLIVRLLFSGKLHLLLFYPSVRVPPFDGRFPICPGAIWPVNDRLEASLPYPALFAPYPHTRLVPAPTRTIPFTIGPLIVITTRTLVALHPQ